MGSAACVRCHPAEAQQRSTLHARTLARVSAGREARRFRTSAELLDPIHNVAYRTTVRIGRCMLQASHGPRIDTAVAEYDFGSGAVANTYLADLKRQYAGHGTHLAMVGEVLQSMINLPPSEVSPGSDRQSDPRI